MKAWYFFNFDLPHTLEANKAVKYVYLNKENNHKLKSYDILLYSL